MKNYETELVVALAAVGQAAALCRAVQRGITAEVLSKKDKSPVTVADFGSQAVVCRALREAFPDDPIIAEEDAAALRETGNAGLLEKVAGHVRAVRGEATPQDVCGWIDHGGGHEYRERFWTLDPIDGTKGFLRGEQYAVALSLIVEGEVTVAALACPNLDGGAVFTAVRGQGAFRTPLPFGEGGGLGPLRAHGIEAPPPPPLQRGGESGEQIHVSATSDPATARFCESVESGHSAHDEAAAVARVLGILAEPVRMDSQCKYAVVASGGADIYMRLPTRADYVERIWDHAAGALIVSEAGGRVTDMAGEPLDFRHGRGLERNRGVLATNGRLHEPLLAALGRVGLT